jgi:hypothetical protein
MCLGGQDVAAAVAVAAIVVAIYYHIALFSSRPINRD